MAGKLALSVVGGRPHLIKAEAVHLAIRGDWQHQRINTISFPSSDYPSDHLHDFDLPPAIHTTTGSDQDALVEEITHVIRASQTDVVVVYGDLSAAEAGALAALRAGVPTLHVEAGYRSLNLRDREELTRLHVDRLSTCCLAPTEEAALNLINEGIHAERIFTALNPIHVTLLTHSNRQERPDAHETTQVLATLHREENLTEPARVAAFCNLMNDLAGSASCEVTLIVYERLRLALETCAVALAASVRAVSTLGYEKYLAEISRADLVVTDSSGLQDEANCLGIPTVTLREKTSRTDTVRSGMNRAMPLLDVQARDVLTQLSRRASSPVDDGNRLQEIEHFRSVVRRAMDRTMDIGVGTVFGVADRDTQVVSTVWNRFLTPKLQMIVNEYRAGPGSQGTGSELGLVHEVAGGTLISYSMGSAISRLEAFAAQRLRPSECRGRLRGPDYDNGSIVALGSTVDNPAYESLIARCARRFPSAGKLRFLQTPQGGISLKVGLDLLDERILDMREQSDDESESDVDANEFSPSVDESGNGTDYAAIVCGPLGDEADNWIMWLAGCRMWGTEAAAIAMTNPDFLQASLLTDAAPRPFALALRVEVRDGRVRRYGLLKSGGRSVLVTGELGSRFAA